MIMRRVHRAIMIVGFCLLAVSLMAQEAGEGCTRDDRLRAIDIPWDINPSDLPASRYTAKGPYIALPKGIQNINEERNIFSSMIVADRLERSHGFAAFCHTANPIGGEVGKHYYQDLVGHRRLVELRIRPWHEYMKDLAHAYMAVHLDVLETRGQFALDCAAVGIPLVGSGSVAARKLFPLTFVEHPRDIDRAVQLCRDLAENPDFYDEAVRHARERLRDYSFKRTRAKFEHAVSGTMPGGQHIPQCREGELPTVG